MDTLSKWAQFVVASRSERSSSSADWESLRPGTEPPRMRAARAFRKFCSRSPPSSSCSAPCPSWSDSGPAGVRSRARLPSCSHARVPQFLGRPCCATADGDGPIPQEPLHRRRLLIVFGRGAGRLEHRQQPNTRARRNRSRLQGPHNKARGVGLRYGPAARNAANWCHFWNSVSRVDASCSTTKACVRGPKSAKDVNTPGTSAVAARMCASCIGTTQRAPRPGAAEGPPSQP